MKELITISNDLYLKKITKMTPPELLIEVSKIEWDESTVDGMPLTTLVQGHILFNHLIYHPIDSDLQCVSIINKAIISGALSRRGKKIADLPVHTH